MAVAFWTDDEKEQIYKFINKVEESILADKEGQDDEPELSEKLLVQIEEVRSKLE